MAQKTNKSKLIAKLAAILLVSYFALSIVYMYKTQIIFNKNKQNFVKQVFILQQQVQALKIAYQNQLTQLQKQLQKIETQVSSAPNSPTISKEELEGLVKTTNVTKQQINTMVHITLLNILHNIEKSSSGGKNFSSEVEFLDNYINTAFGKSNNLTPYIDQLRSYASYNILTKQQFLEEFQSNLTPKLQVQNNNIESKLVGWLKTQIKIENSDKKVSQNNSIIANIQNALKSENYSQAISIINSSDLAKQINWQNFIQKLNQKVNFDNLLKQVSIELSQISVLQYSQQTTKGEN